MSLYIVAFQNCCSIPIVVVSFCCLLHLHCFGASVRSFQFYDDASLSMICQFFDIWLSIICYGISGFVRHLSVYMIFFILRISFFIWQLSVSNHSLIFVYFVWHLSILISSFPFCEILTRCKLNNCDSAATF